MTYVEGSARPRGGILRFFWDVLTRFAKTVGCLAFVGGVLTASWLLQLRRPMIDAARYRPSPLLVERLNRVGELYARSQRAVMEFKGAADLPSEYSAASFVPRFPARYDAVEHFKEAQTQLSAVGAGRDALKRFVLNRFETLTGQIQQKLFAHSASLAGPVERTIPPNTPPVPSYEGIYGDGLNASQAEARKKNLADAKEFLGTLLASAEEDANKKKLEDSIIELGLLNKLFPEPARPVERTVKPAREILDAEKVATRLGEIRASVRNAVLSSWALDDAYDKALETVEAEQRSYLGSDLRVRQTKEQLYLSMGIAMAGGTLVGTFFLLIGDWTQKASTEVRYYWCELLPDFSGTPGEIYETVENAVKERQVPGLECTREFWHEGGAVSAKREYLRFARERLCFEICAAPFGTAFFLSYRATMVPLIIDPLGILLMLFVIAAFFSVLVSGFGFLWGAVILIFGVAVIAFAMRTAIARGLGDLDRVLMKTPLVAPLYELFFRPRTYYRIDSEEMYLKAVHAAVDEAFQSMFGDQGVAMKRDAVQPPVLPELSRS